MADFEMNSMKIIWIGRAALAAVALAAVAFAAIWLPAGVHAADTDWQLTWSDEFDADRVDESKWTRVEWKTPHNNERQAYDAARATVAEGNLVLTADDTEFGGKPYTSGKVKSKYQQHYGRWEIRAKLPCTKGTWPAIWLLPDVKQSPWPSQGEIDIMEHRGDKPELVTSAFHWGPNFHGRKFLVDEHEATQADKPVDYTSDFHVYSVEWNKYQIQFFVDDVLHYTIRDADTDGFLSQQAAPVEVHLNVAVGGDYVDQAQPDESSVWPQEMLVDYVRVYAHKGDTRTGDARKDRIDLNSRVDGKSTVRELQ